MSIDVINFGGEEYPAFQASGHASRFIIPFAQEVCKGAGLDIGAGRDGWEFPGSIPINDGPEYHALKLPKAPWRHHDYPFYNGAQGWEYIFSSHCLEHLPSWVEALDYWTSLIKKGGTLFLYLPCYDQKWWRPWNNRKHINIFTSKIIVDYMNDSGYTNIFWSERDLNHSFAIFGERGR